MSITGRYKYINGEMVKISDRASIPLHTYFPKDTIHSGAHFENLHDKTFATRAEKREYMKNNQIAEG